MHCYLRSSLVIFSCIFVSKSVVSGLSFEYIGYKLYRVIPENDTQLEILLILRNSNSGLFFWNGIDKVGKEVDILVSPDVRSFFLEHLISHNIIVKEYLSIVKILMEQKEQPLTFPIIDHQNQIPILVEENNTTAQQIILDENPINVVQNNSSTIDPVSLIPVQPVPGTKLLTGTFYMLGLLRYSKGFITWAEQSPEKGNNYVQIDFKSSTQQFYSPGGKFHTDAQWMIAPTENANAFLLINRGMPEGTFTWTKETSPNGHFIQLSKDDDGAFYKPGGKWRNDAMLFINATEVEDHYIIQISNLPSAIITWTNKYGGASNKFLQVDTSPGSMTNYHPGQKWRDDVLFRFSPVRKLKLSGVISNFRYGIDNSSPVHPTRKINILTMDKLKIPNNSGISQSFVLRHNKTLASYYNFKFNQTFNHFVNISCNANLPLKFDETLDKNNSVEFLWTQGMELTNMQNMEKTVKDNYMIDTVVTVIPRKTLQVSWYVDWVDDLQVKFFAQIAVSGFIERMSTDRKVLQIPVSVLDVYYLLSSENMLGNIVGIRENEVLVNIQGNFRGTFAMKNNFLTQNV